MRTAESCSSFCAAAFTACKAVKQVKRCNRGDSCGVIDDNKDIWKGRMRMKQREVILSKRIVASLLAGVLLGSAFYAQPAAAGEVIIVTTDQNSSVMSKNYLTDNIVTVGTDGGGTSPSIRGGVLGGYILDSTESVERNQVIIKSGKMSGIWGGRSTSGAVTANSVVIDSGEMRGVYGGQSEGDGAVTYNSVVINGGLIKDADVYGGESVNGAAANNNVTINAGSITADVYGGKSESGAVTNNTVTINDGTFESGSIVYGGKSTSGDATYNSIVVSAGKMSRVFGGNSNKGVAKNNSVNISGGEITGSVYGGNSDEGSAAYNSVIIGSDDGGDTVPAVGGDVYGGYTEGTESAEYNQVIIKSGTMGEIDGGYSYKGDAIGNKVYINGGEMSTVYGGDSSSGDATGNKVYISGDSTINGSVYGGDNSSTGAVIDNEVYISGGTMSFVFGGYSYKGDATGNKVYISGGEVDGVYGGNSSDGNATDNKVYISGGKVYGEIYGGMSSSGAATGNTITISGTPVFEENYTVLYGGYSNSGEVSGNTLNFNSKGLAVANVKNFDVYNFYLPDTVQANDTLLTLTDGAGDGTDLTGSTVNVEGRLAGTSSIQNNDRLVLLANSGSEINAGGRKELGSGEIMQGVSVVYDYITRMSSDNKQVLVEFTNGKATAQSKSPVETQLAAAAFINSGADTVAGSGIASAVQVAGSGSAEMFGAMSGGSMRYKSGSYADVQGYNMALGLAKAVDNNAGKLTYGSLLEYGWGNYTSHLDSGIRADGNTKYYGIGLLARQDNKSGVYYEGSLRYGRMDADYASNDLGTAGVHSSYDSSSAYYGAHLGIGKVTGLNDTTKADVYAKLLYTHQNGDSVTLQGEGNGEEYDFDAVDSTRARVGARVSKAYSERGTGYVGLAYEYEFDGEARATVKGFSTPSPSIKGSSGLLELGYILQPKGVNDPTINIGLQGWGGKKQGVTGNVNFVWTF
jgi:hypothetical protein